MNASLYLSLALCSITSVLFGWPSLEPPAAMCASIPVPELPGAQVLSILSKERYNISGLFQNPGAGDTSSQSNLDVCEVLVEYTHQGINDTVLVLAWLPLKGWNGRFQLVGGGGYIAGYGSYSLGVPAANGFAVAMTNAGNITDTPLPTDEESLLNSRKGGVGPQMLKDGKVNLGLLTNWATRSLHEAAVLGKAVTKSFYGADAHHSYYSGCSNGGRQGYALAQKYPEDFDGILATAPAIVLPSLFLSFVWGQTVMHDWGIFLSPCEFEAFRNASIEACDTLDGVEDGILANTAACDFDPNTMVNQTLKCNGTDVVVTQKTADLIQKIHEGPVSPEGESLWFGLNWGSDYERLAATTMIDGTTTALHSRLGNDYVQYFLKKDPAFDVATLKIADFPLLIAQSWKEYGGIIGINDPDLGPFYRAGGKLLTWHGGADNIIPDRVTLFYRDQVERVMGGYDNVNNFYRIFLAPGVNHCGGGYGPMPTEPLAQLVEWVEQGHAPETITANHVDAQQQVLQRELCVWPLVSRYNGKGDPKLASSYLCANSY